MDKELLELLNKAKNQGANKEQLIQIRDNYALKKKGETKDTPLALENTELVSSEKKNIGTSESQNKPISDTSTTVNNLNNFNEENKKSLSFVQKAEERDAEQSKNTNKVSLQEQVDSGDFQREASVFLGEKEEVKEEISQDAWLDRISTQNFTDDLANTIKDPQAFKKQFIESRDYVADKENGQDFKDDRARRRSFTRSKRNIQPSFEEEIKEREDNKFQQQRIGSEKEYTNTIVNQIKENDGDIKFLSTEQLAVLGLNPMFTPTEAIKINGENTSLMEMNSLLLDGTFVESLKDGKVKVEIDKENKFIKEGFISAEGVNEAEKLLKRQALSGSRFIDLGQHLVKSIVSLPSGILKLPIGIIDELSGASENPAIKTSLISSSPLYRDVQRTIIGLDHIAEELEESTQLYGDGISKSIKKGNYADAGFQVANAGFEMAPLIAASIIAPQAAPAIFAAQATGDKITTLQDERRFAKEQEDLGYILSKEEKNAAQYSSLQILANGGSTGLLNYVLFGGYIKGIKSATKIQSYTGKSLADLKKASQLGYGQGFVNFGKEVLHQEKFFLKMNIGNATIDKLTNTTSHVTGETVIDDAIKGLAFAVPFHASKTYNKNKGIKQARNVLISNLLATSKFGEKEFQRLEDISSILSKLRDKEISEETRTALKDELGQLNSEAKLSHESNLKDIEKLSETQREDFAIRYEKLIERQKAIDELDINSPFARPIQERLLNDKDIYDKDFEAAITNKETATPKAEIKEVSKETNDFVNELAEKKEDIEDVSEFVGGQLKVTIGDSSVGINSKGDSIVIESISTKEGQRGQGSAKKALTKVISIADSQGKTIELNVVPLDKDTTAEGLVKLYEESGFVKDKDFDKEDGGRMVREPNKTQSFEDLISKGELPKTTEAIESDIESKELTIEASINRPVVLTEQGGSKLESPIKGDMYLEGKTVVVEDANGNIFEVGNIDQIGAKNITELGVTVEKSTVSVKDGNLEYKGEAVVPSTNNPLSSIKTNRKGEVNRVVLKSKDGKKTFTLRKQEAEDAAYEILILEAEKNGELTERKLSQNETLKNELRKVEDIAEKNADKDTKRSITVEPTETEVVKTPESKPNKISKPNDSKETAKKEGEVKEPIQIKEVKKVEKKKKATKEPIYESRSRTFTAKLIDGKLVIKSVFGNKKPSKRQVKEVTEQYIEQTNFNKGKKAEFQEGMTQKDARENILEESQNPKEIAEALQQEKESTKEQEVDDVMTIEDAISKAFLRFKISKKDAGLSDLSFPFTNGKAKEKANSLDKIVEEAQTILNEANNRVTDAVDGSNAGFESETIVQKGDVENFIQKYKSTSDYVSNNPKNKTTNRETDLAERFKETTGLEPTTENIEKVSGTKTKEKQEKQIEEDFKNDEVPFQVESVHLSESAKSQRETVDTLEKSGLAKEVKIISDKAIKETLKGLGREGEESPLGFVEGETVYINADKAKTDTPIHEFGHLWAKYAKEKNNAHYQMGLALVEGTPYHEAVKKHPAYKNKSEEAQLNEALSQAIGESGVEIKKESANYPKFQAWFKKLFADIQKGLGFKEMSGEKLSKMSIKDFTRQVAGELLSGKKQRTRTVKNVKSKVESSKITGIEFLMEKQKAITKVKDKLTEERANKKAENKDVKKAFLDYLNENIKRKSLGEATPKELESLLTLYDRTVTEPKLNSAVKLIDRLSDRLDKREYKDHIKTIKSRTIAVESARNKRKSKAEKRKAAQEYLRQSTKDKEYFSTATANDILAIEKAINSNSIEKAIELIDKVTVRLGDRYNLVTARNQTKKRNAEDKLAKLIQKVENEKNRFKTQKANLAAKKKQVAKVEKAILDYINDSFDNKILGEYKISDLRKTTKQTKTKTLEGLQESLKEIDGIVVSLQNKTTNKEIKALLGKGKDTKQSGKVIGKKGGQVQETAIMLKDISKETKTAKSNNKAERETILEVKLYDIITKIEDLKTSSINEGDNATVTLENQRKLNSLDLSAKIIGAKLESDPFIKARMLDDVKTQLEFIVKNGKHLLEVEREVQMSKLEGEQVEILPEIDANNSRETVEWNNTMDNIKIKYNSRNIVGKTAYKGFVSPLYSNLTTIRKKLSRNPYQGTAIKGFQRLIVDVDFAEIAMNQINNDWGGEINAIKSKVFKGYVPSKKVRLENGKLKVVNVNAGAKTKADFALSEGIEITVRKAEGDVKQTYSASVLLDVLLKSKNPNNLVGLEKTGFTESTISEIESKLSPKVKQYGEEVMAFYKSKYKEINDVYRKIYFRDLPFDPFYSGKTNISGAKSELELSMFEGVQQSHGTTAGGSLKTKTQHGEPITPSNVDSNLGNYITQMSRFIAYAEVHRRLNKTLNNPDFQKAVYMNNKGKGGDLLDQLTLFKRRNIEKTNIIRGSQFMNTLNRNYVTYTLGGKPKQISIQMVSAINGQFSMPKGMSLKEYGLAHSTFFNDGKYIMENSPLIKQRLDTKQAIKAFSSIEDTYSYTNTKTKNDRVNLMFRLLGDLGDGARATGMIPIKVGDMLGVAGSIPVFGAAKIKIKQQNPTWSDAKVAKEALLVFEDSVNRTQQGQTKGVKSEVQNNPYLKLLINFKTTPILNTNEAWIALNDMKKGGKSEKSKAQNISAIVNFGILQNSAYTLINTADIAAKGAIIHGSFELLKALFDDEDNKDQLKQFSNTEKDFLFSILGGQFLDATYVGAFKTIIDIGILKKDFTFGTTLPLALKEELDTFDKNLETYLTTENPITKRKAGSRMVTSMVAVFSGIPPKSVIEYFQYQAIITGENVFNEEEREKLRSGYSFSSVNFMREERTGIKLNDLLQIEDSGDKIEFTKEEVKTAEKEQVLLKAKNEAKEEIKSGKKLYTQAQLQSFGLTQKWQNDNANINSVKLERDNAIRKIKAGKKLYNQQELKRLKITPKWQNDNRPK